MANRTLALYERISRWPAGRWLFSRIVCFKAPYFGSISPRIEILQPNRCEATLRHRRKLTNHLGTVHAIAMCNLAEFAGGLMTEASVPDSMRWIPKGMTVQYLQKAVGILRAVATPSIPIMQADVGYEVPVDVLVSNAGGDAVFRATISMWVSPRRQ